MESKPQHRHPSRPPSSASAWLKRRALEVLGWLLVAAGLAALLLPGPGMLLLAAGLAVLAYRYHWARRRLSPVRARALDLAEHGVRTLPRILTSIAGSLGFIAAGILWGLGGPAPQWWPLDDTWWLIGGWGTGATLILSGVLALAVILYSVRRFRNPTST